MRHDQEKVRQTKAANKAQAEVTAILVARSTVRRVADVGVNGMKAAFPDLADRIGVSEPMPKGAGKSGRIAFKF